jgi:hypothetical protein
LRPDIGSWTDLSLLQAKGEDMHAAHWLANAMDVTFRVICRWNGLACSCRHYIHASLRIFRPCTSIHTRACFSENLVAMMSRNYEVAIDFARRVLMRVTRWI